MKTPRVHVYQLSSRLPGLILDPPVPQTCTVFGRRTMCTSRWPLPSGRPPPLISPVPFGALGEEGGCGCGSVVMVVIPRCPHCSNERYPGKYAVILRSEFHYQSQWAIPMLRRCKRHRSKSCAHTASLYWFFGPEVLLFNKKHQFPVPSAQS